MLCAVTKATERLGRTVAEGTWQIPKLSAPFYCILEWGGGELLVFDWGADRINYNCTGGWKAMEQKGYARCKEGILHNLKLWATL